MPSSALTCEDSQVQTEGSQGGHNWKAWEHGVRKEFISTIVPVVGAWSFLIPEKCPLRAVEMAQNLRGLVVLLENLGSGPRMHRLADNHL